MTENLDAARALLPGASWLPWAIGALGLPGGALSRRLGEPNGALVGAAWATGLALAWGAFNPAARVAWALGGGALAVAAWASVPGDAAPRATAGDRPGARLRALWGRARWPLLVPFGLALAAPAARLAPVLALTTGVGGVDQLIRHALDRADAGELDEAIVFGEAGGELARLRGTPVEEAQAELVTASLYAAEGDCTTAVTHARVAHLELGSDLPTLDAAVRSCFAARGP